MAEVETDVDPLDAAFADIREAEASDQEEAVESAPSDQDQPRDEQDDVAETGQAEQDQAEKPSDEAPAEPPADTDQQAEEEQSEDEPDEVKPIAYNADGSSHEIEGSEVGEDGSWRIPSAQVPKIQSLLTAGHHHLGGWQQQLNASKQAVETANTERDAAKTHSQALTEKFQEILNLPDEQFAERMYKFRDELPRIMLDAEKAATEAQAKADRDKLQHYEAQEALKTIEPVWANGLEGEMEKLAAQERFNSLAREDLQSIFTHLWNGRLQGLFVHHENQWFVNTPQIEQAMEYAVKFRRDQQKQVKVATETKKKNETETGTKKKEVPTTVPAKTGPTPTGEVAQVEDPLKGAKPEEAMRVWEDWFDDLDVT